MKLIKPAEISAKIMTLIDEAEKELVIVSPYNNLTGWNKLINRIKDAQSRGVEISWYTRKNNVDKNNSEEVLTLGIEPVLVDDLHAKIYMNEDYAIFTSMNMSKISDEKSIDLGYITETKTEYEELYNVFIKHIKSKKSTNKLKYQPLNSDELYFKAIHEHIYHKYGSFKFSYKSQEVLEYFEFIRQGFRIQFLPYSQALKLQIYLPQTEVIFDVEDKILRSSTFKKLYNNQELQFCYDESPNYIKYYFEKNYKKLNGWGPDVINQFLDNFDILINILFK